MSINAAVIMKMVELGLQASDIAELCLVIEQSDRQTKEASPAALRQRKYRASVEARKAQDITSDVTRDVIRDATNDVTASRDARVRDITPTTETSGISSAAFGRDENSEIEWPEGDKPSRAYCEQLEAELRKAAGPSINAAAPMLQIVAPILALSRAGKGPPCDLQADVLPAIRACAAKTSPGHAERWDYFVPAIRQARDRRMAGAPAAAEFSQRAGTGPPGNNIVAQRSAEQAEVRRRVMESENG